MAYFFADFPTSNPRAKALIVRLNTATNSVTDIVVYLLSSAFQGIALIEVWRLTTYHFCVALIFIIPQFNKKEQMFLANKFVEKVVKYDKIPI